MQSFWGSGVAPGLPFAAANSAARLSPSSSRGRAAG